MAKFIYSEILSEYKNYLHDNLEETIYFESKRILDISEDQTYYLNLIKNEKFEINKVLNKNNSIEFCNKLRSQRKIRDYEKYTFDFFDQTKEYSELENRINSIQTINTIANLNKKNIFKEIRNDNDKLPISVIITTKNFEFKFDSEPDDNLFDLLQIIETPKYENLFYNYNRFYFSYENLNSAIASSIKDPKRNIIYFLYALLFVFLRKEEKHSINLIGELVKRLVKQAKKYLPPEIDKKYHIIEEINSKIQNLK
ncbi:hypothetical protein [Winogradskyella flava]|uniref:Uncharacterized protein n=1 Tax=Winogradskyella flava TaxID=1884876 RepID=A0A842IVF2_9FLAO|nr:hypothetical protein [Winogradskyella flava]MBC2845703.1 hypothetical protein [Winogradskyella flava]